ncbi:MAG: hypothetical protein AB7T06_45740 [Kofleriaceae bacterium]
MIRLIVLFATLTACTEEPPPEPHELVECDMGWKQNGYTECEGACQKSSPALLASGPGCAGTTSNGPVNCQKTFEYMDLVGCCIASSPKMLFAECNP